MKTNPLRLMLVSSLAFAVAIPSSFAQRELGKKKGPTSKIYIAEASGETQLQNGDKIYTLRQATAFDAPGTVIETKAGAHSTLVYSNGTGMFVDENTRVEVNSFVQEPFNQGAGNLADSLSEPSISRSDIFVSRGAVGVCTNQLISGSAMLYSTPQGQVNIRGGKIAIECTELGTFIDLMEGDVTVRLGNRDIGGQILRPGERATILSASSGGIPIVTIGPIPKEAMQVADERISGACTAKQSVSFDVIAVKAAEGLDQPADEAAGAAGDEGTQEIVVRSTVPVNPPSNIVVSPDRLPGT
jgi:hypothetical protein